MKIAFVGKGGSGKSTVSALFIRHLVSSQQHVLAVDADINQHLAELVGAPFKPELALSNDDNKLHIRTHLRGTNKRIEHVSRMIKTTPPGHGSALVKITASDPIITKYGTKFAKNGYFMHVGTYKEDGIGISCYHSDLAVVENLISHTTTGKHEWLIVDMVAGTDAFAGALHAMFDVIFIVTEPTPESIGVFRQFSRLAKEAGVADRVFAIGNKIADADDRQYLTDSIGDGLVASLVQDTTLRKARQRGEAISTIPTSLLKDMAGIEQVARANQLDPNRQLTKLHKLHSNFAAQDFTIAKHGDLSGQIDAAFRFDPEKDRVSQ